MKRTILSIILFGFMVVSIAGCGSSDAKNAKVDEFIQAVQSSLSEESILDIKMDKDNLIISVDLSDALSSPTLPDGVKSSWVAESWYSSITDSILELEDYDDLWETITVDFGDAGSITCGKSSVETNEFGGRYFRSIDYIDALE